jgi:hypothetical protein
MAIIVDHFQRREGADPGAFGIAAYEYCRAARSNLGVWQQVSAARPLAATARRHEAVPPTKPSVDCSRREPDLHW